MKKSAIFGLLSLFIFMLPLPVFAEDVIEPEFLKIVDSWLISDPQPHVDHHVIRVCDDDIMTVNCTQCIYGAGDDGAVKIPTYNRCIFRAQKETSPGDQPVDAQYFQLFYQLKAVSTTGLESDWTAPKEVYIYKNVNNQPTYCGAVLSVHYNI
jgi:hypothetical protein